MDFVRRQFITNENMLPISFIKIRFSCNQNIEKTLFFTMSEYLSNILITGNRIFMKEMGNCPEFHSERNNFLRHFSWPIKKAKLKLRHDI